MQRVFKMRPFYIISILEGIFVASNIIQCSSETIGEEILKYFENDKLNAFRTKWNQFRPAFDNAISMTLKEDYKSNIMNIYSADQKKDLIVSHGLYASDNCIQLVLLDMLMRATPRLFTTAVNVALPSNVMRVEGQLDTIYLDTRYKLYRNRTSLLDQGEQDPFKDSPFTFAQVQTDGDLTVIVQECVLIGTVVTTLVGDSLSLGHDTLRLADCKFSLEISARDLGEPPVIAPYFSNEKGLELMQLISKPIREKLIARLQGTALSYINTTDVFGDNIFTYKKMQKKLFQLTRDYNTELVSNINKITSKENQGILKLENLTISWFENDFGEPELSLVALSNVTVSGLETAYSPNSGGPYKLKNIKITEAITFSNLQVRGNLFCENKTISAMSEFAADILDYSVSVTVNITVFKGSNKKKQLNFAPLGWRALEFSIIHLEGFNTERAQAYSFITGYLSDNIPKKLVAYLSQVYDLASQITEKEGAYKAKKSKQDMVPQNDNVVGPEEPTDDEINNNGHGIDKYDDGQANEQEFSDQEVHVDNADSEGFGEKAKTVKLRRNVVSQSENEEGRIFQKRSDNKRT